MKRQLFTASLLSLSILAFTLPVHAVDNERYLLIEETASPDGRFAVGWGLSDYSALDGSDLNKLLSTVNLDLVENYLVDLEHKEIVATLGSTYFPGKNHGGLTALWRGDSGALFILESGKWEYIMAAVTYLVDEKGRYGQFSDVKPVTVALRKAIKEKLLNDHPKEGGAIDNFAISAHPVRWMGDNQLMMEMIGEIPKAEDSFTASGRILVTLPKPVLVTVTDTVGGNSPQKEEKRTITSDSAGPIQLGMTIATARKAMPSATFSRSTDGDGMALIAVKEGRSLLMNLFAGEEDSGLRINENAVIEFIEVWNSGFQTAEGVHPGMAIRDVETRYGKVTEIMMSEIESREYGTFTQRVSGLNFRLIGQNGTAGAYKNGVRLSSSYMTGSTIFSIGISGAHIMQDGSIGGIRVGDTAAGVLGKASQGNWGQVFKGEDEIWEAFNQAGQSWLFPDAGLSFDMISDKIGGPKTVFSITMKDQSRQNTGLRIRLGDPKEKIIKAYSKFKTYSEESAGFFDGQDVHLVGSIYGGMVFHFKNGKLSEVFLGASAE